MKRSEALRLLLSDHLTHIVGLIFTVAMLSVGIHLCVMLRHAEVDGRIGVWTVRVEPPEPIRAGYKWMSLDEYRRERKTSGLICIAVGMFAGLWTFIAATDSIREREVKREMKRQQDAAWSIDLRSRRREDPEGLGGNPKAEHDG